jgi:hypothetical protein
MEAGSFVYATVDGSGSLQPTPFAVGAYNPRYVNGAVQREQSAPPDL